MTSNIPWGSFSATPGSYYSRRVKAHQHSGCTLWNGSTGAPSTCTPFSLAAWTCSGRQHHALSNSAHGGADLVALGDSRRRRSVDKAIPDPLAGSGDEVSRGTTLDRVSLE